ncbi:MAG: hypothetical protein MSG64_09450 [Pyrinomonadaceae bacterium MAG19_C2-C3]|nr:hypothetical protein [Pyrinomonadaceae bacterium MAG19_C2-C3]
MDILGETLSIPVKRNETGALIRLPLERWEHILDEHPRDFLTAILILYLMPLATRIIFSVRVLERVTQ